MMEIDSMKIYEIYKGKKYYLRQINLKGLGWRTIAPQSLWDDFAKDEHDVLVEAESIELDEQISFYSCFSSCCSFFHFPKKKCFPNNTPR